MNDFFYSQADYDGYSGMYEEPNSHFDFWKIILMLTILAMILGILNGCGTKYVAVPEYHTQYVVKSDTLVKYDSVRIHDSVFVYHSGDTVIINKIAYRDRWKNVYRTKTDTIVKTDSVVCKIEKELTPMQQRYMKVGKWVCGAFAWIILLVVAGWLWWLAGKKSGK